MKLFAIAAVLAVCGAAKLDRTYLPPASAVTAGGSPDSLQTPFSRSSSDQGKASDSLPIGSYTNSFEGVVVDADAAGIRASPDGDQSGLGRPRESYGSENSKVGEAAFRGSASNFRGTPTFGSPGLSGQFSGVNSGQFGSFESKSERPQAFKDRNSNIITYANDVSPENYSYGFESDNGIAVGENGVDNNGIQAQGGYSYKGDDGQVYKVTYIADEGGYRPQGDHLPTPPPIPKEILESLEQNAKEEAAGIVDDGSYDAQKYNVEGDYAHSNGGNNQYNSAQLSQFAKPESGAAASNTFVNQNNQAFGIPGELGNIGAQNVQANYGQSNSFGSSSPNNQGGLAGSLDKQSSHTTNQHQPSLSAGLQSSTPFGQNSGSQLQFGQNQSAVFGSLNNQQVPATHFDTQFNQFGSQNKQPGSANQPESQGSLVGSASQFGSRPAKPSFGQGSNFAFTTQLNQGSYFGNQALKPQTTLASSAQAQSFGLASQYNDQVNSQSLQTQFGNAGENKPTFGSFDSSKPSLINQGQGQTINNNGNRFPNTPNQFGPEYLPPINSNDRPSHKNPQMNIPVTSIDSNSQYTNFIPLEAQNQSLPQGSSASAFASVGLNGFESQTAKPFNAFDTQSLASNQPNYNNQLTSHGQRGSNNLPTSSQNNVPHTIPTLAFGTKPTTVPQTELTTPLEPNEKPTVSQESQFHGQSVSNFGNLGFPSLNNQAKPQTGVQSNIAATANQQYIGQTPSFADSRPQGTSQLDSTSPAPVLPAQQQPSAFGQKPQIPQNAFSQNQQNNAYYSTQKASYSQGSDDSYYYDRPSKPFGISSAQGSRFPSSPSYQPNGVVSSQTNQYSNQQGIITGSTKFPSSSSVVSAIPTPSKIPQNQGIATNYYNGITQASISSFPSVSPTTSTTSTQYGSTQSNQFEYKPSVTQQFVSQPQSNRPTIQQHSSVPSFPTKPDNSFGQNPSSSLNQNQILFGQTTSNINNLPSATSSVTSKPSQTSSTSFTETEIQFGQSSPTNDTQTQQYEGTVYEYNKPAEVLPAPEQTDSSSSQSVQSNLSTVSQESQKPNTQQSQPQFGSQQTQFSQNTFSSQTQQSNLNQPQYSQSFKPFGSSPNTINTQFGHNTHSTLQPSNLGSQDNLPTKPNEPTLLPTSQFSQSSQTSSGPRPQFGSQPIKPFGSIPSFSQPGQNTQQPQDTSHTTSFAYNQEGSQNGLQPLKPFSSTHTTTTQFDQTIQPGFGSTLSQQNAGTQLGTQSNKPFGSASSSSQFGQPAQNQSSFTTGFTSTQINSQSSQPGAQSTKPFGIIETTQNFQGYPSSKPQYTQFSQHQFTQSSQTFGSTQINPQLGHGSSNGALPTKPFGNAPSIPGFPQSQSGSTQFNQGVPSVPSFGQQSFQNSQFGSSALKPQFGTTQFIQNQKPPNKPFSTTVQNQFNQNTLPVSSSGVTQQQPQAYNPGALSTQGSSSLSQTKPQSDQSPQPSQGSSSTSFQSQFGAQAAKPFGSSESLSSQVKPFGSSSLTTQNKPQTPQNKPLDSQGSPCCQGSDGSSIRPINVGKPSQAFAQTQNQFSGFQGVQGVNAQSVAGKGEDFSGPKQPPSFDAQTGYHY